jgi:pimeloyl-ACP methyl ester carboxylesterase
MGTPAKFTLQRVPAAPPRYKEEEVRFQNGNITLAGTLLLPVGKGPHPAVVFIHGSGPETRAASRFLADHFARRGIASLIYDKRGTGASTGNWESAGFGDLADDALAAVQFLKSRTEINHRQIGLRGQSQGGWIAPLTASRSSDVAFIIIVSGPTVPPWQQETYKVQARTRAMGLPESEVVEAVGLMKLKFEVASTGKGWEQLAAAWEKARGKKWYPLTNPLNTLAALQEVWRREFAFDPVPVLETVTCPLLGIYGESDSNVQTKESAAILEKALGKAGNKDFTIKIFPKADHAILVWPDPKGQSHWLRFADGYIETMTEWLLKHAKASK